MPCDSRGPRDWDNGVIMKFTGPLAALALGSTAFATAGATAAERIKDDFTFTYHIEVAGADESDVATKKQLQDSGTNMVPTQPTAASRDPLNKPEPAEVKKAAPKPVPAEEQKIEPAAAGAEGKAPAAAAQEASPAPEAEKPAETMGDYALDDSDLLFKPYLRIDGGYTMTSDPEGTGRNGPHLSSETQNTGVVSLGLGTRVEDQVRIEGMLSYRSPMELDGTDGANSGISGEVESISAMFNLYYDVKQVHEWIGNDTITPYVGAGVGISMLETDSLVTAGGTTERGTQVYNLTYAAMAGVSSKVSDFVTLDLGYRFINLGQFEQDGSFSNGITAAATKNDDLLAHEFRAGVRLQF